MLSILTVSIGAFECIFFSSVKIFAFWAIKDLFFFNSSISIIGKSWLIFNFFATGEVMIIL